MNYLQNKTAIITGASSGLGAASARALSEKGVRIVAAALDQQGLDAIVSELKSKGGEAVGRVSDVTNPGGSAK